MTTGGYGGYTAVTVTLKRMNMSFTRACGVYLSGTALGSVVWR